MSAINTGRADHVRLSLNISEFDNGLFLYGNYFAKEGKMHATVVSNFNKLGASREIVIFGML